MKKIHNISNERAFWERALINSADFHENIQQVNKQLISKFRTDNDSTDITSALNHHIKSQLSATSLKNAIETQIETYQKFLDDYYPPTILDINPSYSVRWNKEQLINADIHPWHAYIFHTQLSIPNSADFINFHVFKTTLLILSAEMFYAEGNFEASWALLYEFLNCLERYKKSIESGEKSSPEWRSSRAKNASKARTKKYKAIDEKMAQLIKEKTPKNKFGSMRSVCRSLAKYFQEEQKLNKTRMIEDILYNRLTDTDSLSRKAYFENCMDKHKKKDYLSQEEQT